MTLGSALAAGRARHRVLLVETCQVTRDNAPTLNPATDTYSDTPTVIYDGPCRVKQFRMGRAHEAGQVSVMERPYDVHLPFDGGNDIMRGDTLTVTSSTDPAVLGRPLVVIEVNFSGTTTARHVLCEDRS